MLLLVTLEKSTGRITALFPSNVSSLLILLYADISLVFLKKMVLRGFHFKFCHSQFCIARSLCECKTHIDAFYYIIIIYIII